MTAARLSRSTVLGAFVWAWMAGVVPAPFAIAEDSAAEVAGAGSAADDPRDLLARKAFASGDYSRALALYIELFAAYPEEVIYYRNIGRCYQSLGQPERAIASFQNYQRRGSLNADEAAEIARYIDEMKQLQRAREEEARRRADERAGVAERRRTRTRIAGYSLIAVAPVLATIGLGLGIKAKNRGRQVNERCTPDDPCDAQEWMEPASEGEQAERSQWWLLGAAGATLVAGGLVLLLARKPSSADKAVAMGLSWHGGPALRLSRSW